MNERNVLKTTTTKDGYTVQTCSYRAFRNGYSAWDGWKNVRYWVFRTPSGIEFSPGMYRGVLACARQVEPIAQAVVAKRIKTVNGLRKAFEKAGLDHNGGISGALYCALYTALTK